MRTRQGLWYCVFASLAMVPLVAGEHRGRVTFGGLPVPGATVTASRADRRIAVITDPQGDYKFDDLADGTWRVEVELFGFSTLKKDVAVVPSAPGAEWQLEMLPLDQMHVQAQKSAPESPARQPAPTGDTSTTLAPDQFSQRAADGLLINGTANNGAASPFAQSQAFGNNRSAGRSLYNANLGVILDNSALDARSFSLTGQDTPKPAYNRLQGVASFGGPVRIPHLLRNGPNLC